MHAIRCRLALFYTPRFQRCQVPVLLLMALLQRTPLLRWCLVTETAFASGSLGQVLRSAAFVTMAAGLVDTLAGATTFTASPASPAAATVGTAFSAAFSVTGAPSNVKTYTIDGLPAGLDVPGATLSGTTLMLNASTGTITGTPTTAGSFTTTITAWEKTGAKGNNKAYTYKIDVTGGSAIAPSITTQPASQTVNEGGSVTFNVAASGTAPLSYQWKKGGTAIAGATSSSYAISATVAGDAGSYTVVVTNSVGSATSNAATLTVNTVQVGTAPSITTQPASQTVSEGASVTFSVAASGTAPLSYQWKKGGATITGATSSSYAISAAVTGDAGSYTVVVTNSVGSATSNAATLTVNAAPKNTAPSITTQPASQTVSEGASVTFTVVASGTAPLSYQWKKGGSTITGATSSSYAISAAVTGDAGSYTVVVTNSVGSATSNAATLTVNAAPKNTAPSITTQPASQTVSEGASVTFSVVASGTAPLSYQWKKGGATITGATSSSYAISAAVSGDAGSYTVVVTNSVGSATSNAATLTVNAAPVNTAPSITTQPASLTVSVGNAASFSVSAAGSAPLTYQWRKNGAAIAGATAASYNIAAVSVDHAGTYSVVVGNGAGSVTSADATLTVNVGGAPNITAPLLPATVTANHSTTFSAQTFAGATYQWQVSTNGGSSWTNVANDSTYSGATSDTLTVTGVASGMNQYQYRYVVTTAGGTSTSAAATLAVVAVFFPSPAGIAPDGRGGLLVTDATNNNVQQVSATGAVAALAGRLGAAGAADGTGTAATFNQPGGLAVTAAGAAYIADTANATIRLVGADGAVSTWAGASGKRGSADGTGTAATFNGPTAVALDSAGNLYVADTGNSTIRRISAAGVVTTVAGSAGITGTADGPASAARFNHPAGLAVDAAGNLYVADTFNHTIRRIAAGTVSTLAGVAGISGFGDGAGGNATFNQPGALALDAAGNLYVADGANNILRVVTPAGQARTLAGLPTVAGLEDGTGLGALFNQPRGLAIDAAGNLFVADAGNAALRKVTPAGVVTTLALSAAPTAGSGGTASPGAGAPSGGSSGGTGTGGSSGGSGGGAVSPWFALAVAGLVVARTVRRRSPHAGRSR